MKYSNIKFIILTVKNFGMESTKWLFTEIDRKEPREFSFMSFINKHTLKLSKWEK